MLSHPAFPTSLAQVAEQCKAGRPFHLALGEFLDHFYAHPDPGASDTEPCWLQDAYPDIGAVYDAYLAASAEALALRLGVSGPEWAKSPGRGLRRPWFASPAAALRALLIHESPAPFRARNLFVSENALSRV
jgi:hypothetical protein